MTEEEKTTTENTSPAPEAKVDKPAEKPAAKPEEKKKDDNRRGGGGGNRGRRGGGRGRRDKEPKEFEEAVLQIDRVTRVVKGGRRMRFRIAMVIGDKKGRVGYGLGKSGEVLIGIQKSVAKAKRELINVPIFNDTIPHEVNGTFKASRVLLFPAPEGKGVIAGGAVRKILELAGVKNVLSKVHGSRNRVNIAVATFKALQMLSSKAPYGTKKEKEVAAVDPEGTPEAATPEKEAAKPAKKSVAKKAPAKKSESKK